MPRQIYIATVLHNGWELDNAAWVDEDANGNRELKTTNHGCNCTMSKEDLNHKIAETERSLNELKHIAGLMGYDSNLVD